MLCYTIVKFIQIILRCICGGWPCTDRYLATCSNVARYAKTHTCIMQSQACTGFAMHVRKKFTLMYIIRYVCRPPIRVLNTSVSYCVGGLRSYLLSTTHLDRVSLINVDWNGMKWWNEMKLWNGTMLLPKLLFWCVRN